MNVEEKLESFHRCFEIIDGLLESIDKRIACLHQSDAILNNKISAISDKLDKFIFENDNYNLEIGKDLYMIFYKVFPEATEADRALKRAMDSQKKKPSD